MKLSKQEYLSNESKYPISDISSPFFKECVRLSMNYDDIELHRLFWMNNNYFINPTMIKPEYIDAFYSKSRKTFYRTLYIYNCSDNSKLLGFSNKLNSDFKFFDTAQAALRYNAEECEKKIKMLQQHKEIILNQLIIK